MNPVWPNGWMFVYELSDSGFECSCSHLTFRFGACFKQGVPWRSGNCGFALETRKWHEKNIQSIKQLFEKLTLDPMKIAIASS